MLSDLNTLQSYEFIYNYTTNIDVQAYFIDELGSSGEPPSRRPARQNDTMKNTAPPRALRGQGLYGGSAPDGLRVMSYSDASG